MNISAQQETAINTVVSNYNAIIGADAGTGKTFTLKQAAAHLFSVYANKDKKLLISQFNTKNRIEWQEYAKQIKDYIKKSKGYTPSIESKTYHKMGNDLLGKSFEKFSQYSDNFEVLSYFQKSENEISYSSMLFKRYIEFYESCKGRNITLKRDIVRYLENVNALEYLPSDYSLDTFAETLEEIFKFSAKGKKYKSASDMVFFDLLTKNKKEVVKYDVIFLDEFQDLSLSQLHIVMEYCHENTQLIFVGDRKQQINVFMGSLPFDTLIEKIAEKFPNHEFHNLQLTESYRNSQKVLDFVNKKFGTTTKSANDNDGDVYLESTLDTLYTTIENDVNTAILCLNNEPLQTMYSILLAKGYNPIYDGFNVPKDMVAKVLTETQSENLEDLSEALERKFKILFKSKNLLTTKQIKELPTYKVLQTIKASLKSFNSLMELKAFFSTPTPKDAKNVILSTCHKAKGMTYKSVFVLEPSLFNVTEQMTADNARQTLCAEYVAYTRPSHDLHIISEEIFTVSLFYR